VDDLRARLKRLRRSPAFFFAATLLCLIFVGLATGLFSGTRTVHAPLPYPEPDRLVSCYQVHFLSLTWGVQSRYIRPWQENSRTLGSLAAYQAKRYRAGVAGSPAEEIEGARITPGFFSLLGVEPAIGRTFDDRDASTDALVILSHGIWRKHLGADPKVVGKRISLDGQAMQVVGVLPPAFWFRSRELQVWTLLPDLSRQDPATRLVGAVGRLRHGVTMADARSELQAIAWRSSRFRGGAFRVAPLGRSLRPELQFILFSFTVGAALAAGISSIQCLRSWRSRGHWSGELGRYWLFLAAKSVLLLGGLTILAVELAARNALALHSPYKFALSLLIDWASILGTLLVLRWAILDQSRRCPVCLRRLGMAVTLGSWSSSLIEPASTELLCDQGHGALHVSDSYSTLGEIRRWIAMEDSWRELIAAEKR
jgi:hypothetical protein